MNIVSHTRAQCFSLSLLALKEVRMQLYGQLNPGKPVPSFPTLLSNMVKNDGIGSIYKGVDAAIGRQMVYGTARIGLHRKISDKLVQINDGNPINFFQKTLSGMASGSIAVCIGTPFDIALVRLQADSMAPVAERRNYKNVFDVSKSCIFRDDNVYPVLIMQCTIVGSYSNDKGGGRWCIIQGTGAEYFERNGHERWYACLLRSSKRSGGKTYE